MKTIIIIAPYFPPSALPPSQRVRLLARHLYEFDWKTVVLTVEPQHREEIPDPWMEELVGDNFTKIIIKSLDQRKTRKFGIGDLGLRLIPFLFLRLRKIAKQYKADFILYPVPPWYIMVIAPVIKWLTGIPYGIDFIDPWVTEGKKVGGKARMSQWIARRMEGFAVKSSSVIFAVSQGILNDLVKRYGLKDKPLIAVPYGVELNDYEHIPQHITRTTNEDIRIRYIGAISDSMQRIVSVLLKSLKQVHEQVDIKVEFIGTSYAGKGFVQPCIQSKLDDLGLNNFVEKPARVTYRQALELTRSADILLLVGDMTPYYAASKLMGLIASQQPFFAMLHKDSFPARFLRELNYPFVIEYSGEEGFLPESRELIATKTILQLINGLKDFKPVPLNNPAFLQHTAWGMTKTFVDTIQKVSA